MREYGSNINLPSLDNLFSSEQERQDAKLEKIQILPLTELHPFRNHPFQVRDDDEMDKMVDSVKAYGVMTPAIVRPRQDGGYEIVAGHRRCHASQRAGVETMPCIVRDMDDDTAIILMVDSNCQREHILPSEKAKAYEMKLEAIRRKAGRPSKENSRQVVGDFESADLVGQASGESGRQVQRFIRLNKLTPELMKMVDERQRHCDRHRAGTTVSDRQSTAWTGGTINFMIKGRRTNRIRDHPKDERSSFYEKIYCCIGHSIGAVRVCSGSG